MIGGYDGTLRFNTKADTKGLNEGLTKASNQLKSIGKVLVGIGKALAVAVIAVIAVVGVIVGLVVAAVRGMLNLASTTVDAAGEMASYGAKVEELKQTFAELKAALTDAFRPLVLAAMPWINAVATALTGVLNMVAQVLAALTGQEGYWKTVTAAANASGEAAEEAKGPLAAFDKINVLQKPNEGGGGGGGGGTGQEWVPIGEEAQGWADKVLETWGKIKEFLSPIIEALGRVKDAFVRLWDAAVPILEDIWADLLPIFVWLRDQAVKIIDAIAIVIGKVADYLKEHPDLWDDIKTAIADWWDKAEVPLTIAAALIGGIATAVGLAILAFKAYAFIMGIVNTVTAVWALLTNAALLPITAIVLGIGLLIAAIALLIIYWDEISAWAITAWENIQKTWAVASEWFDTNVIQPVVGFFQGLWASVGGFFSNLWTDIQTVWNTVSEWFNTNIITPLVNFFTGLGNIVYIIFYDLWLLIRYVWNVVADWFKEHVIDPVVTFFQQLWTDVSGFFTDLWEDIKAIWDTVSTWFNEHVTAPVTEWFKGVWTDVSGFFTDLWEDIKAVWETVSNWFQLNVIDPVVTAWDTATGSIKGFFTGMWDDIKAGAITGVNKVIDIINGWISGIIGGINSLIDKWNSIPIPGWLTIPPIGVPQIPHVPQLATGAVIPPNAEFLAMLGDQRMGRNIEAPENLIREIMQEELTKMSGFNQPQTIHNVLKLDGRVVYESWDRENRRVGPSLLTKGTLA